MDNTETLFDVQLNTNAVVLIQDVQYEFIRIKLLDCRTGNALSTSRVDKIVVKQGEAEVIATQFDRNDELIEGTDGIVNSLKALKRLGFIAQELEAYTAEAKTAYNKYWESRASNTVPELTAASTAPNEVFYSLIINEYNSHYQTDGNGILNLRIPQIFFDNKEVSVEISFFDFPIFLEEIGGDTRSDPVRRNQFGQSNPMLPVEDAPECKVVWNNNGQSNVWNGNWGWEAQKKVQIATQNNLNNQTVPDNPAPTQTAVNCTTEFKMSEAIVIKNTTSAFNNNSSLDSEFSSIMSVFFNSTNINTHHFVLFAMQWCQPAWDGIEDPNPECTNPVRSNDNTFINMNIINFAVDGDIGNGTKSAIRELIRAQYYCAHNDLVNAERIIASTDDKVSNSKIQAFVNKYVDGDEIPDGVAYSVIRDFHAWFTDNAQVSFNNMCLNAPI